MTVLMGGVQVLLRASSASDADVMLKNRTEVLVLRLCVACWSRAAHTLIGCRLVVLPATQLSWSQSA